MSACYLLLPPEEGRVPPDLLGVEGLAEGEGLVDGDGLEY
jgi:hypothetical protein